MPMSPEDKHARRVFMHLDAIQSAISDKASMVSEAALKFYRERGGENATLPDAFTAEVARVRTELMHYISHPDSDLDTLEINAAPWPKPEDYSPDEPVTLSEAPDESIRDNPDLFDEEAPADPAVDPRDAELEALRARVAELEASPPPSPAVVALEGMEADPDLASIPREFRGVMVDGESVAKFTERMRSRYRYLKHMQMDGAKPTSARALPDMTDEERVEMESMQARGAEAVAWLERE